MSAIMNASIIHSINSWKRALQMPILITKIAFDCMKSDVDVLACRICNGDCWLNDRPRLSVDDIDCMACNLVFKKFQAHFVKLDKIQAEFSKLLVLIDTVCSCDNSVNAHGCRNLNVEFFFFRPWCIHGSNNQ